MSDAVADDDYEPPLLPTGYAIGVLRRGTLPVLEWDDEPEPSSEPSQREPEGRFSEADALSRAPLKGAAGSDPE